VAHLYFFQSRARTHAVLVIGLYELLGISTTKLIEPPGPSSTYLKKFEETQSSEVVRPG
jgi:hypothetical protein